MSQGARIAASGQRFLSNHPAPIETRQAIILWAHYYSRSQTQEASCDPSNAITHAHWPESQRWESRKIANIIVYIIYSIKKCVCECVCVCIHISPLKIWSSPDLVFCSRRQNAIKKDALFDFDWISAEIHPWKVDLKQCRWQDMWQHLSFNLGCETSLPFNTCLHLLMPIQNNLRSWSARPCLSVVLSTKPER